MMKVSFLLIFLLLITLIFAFDQPQEIDVLVNREMIVNMEENARLINDKLWVLYYDYAENSLTRLKLAIEQEDGSFEVIELDGFLIPAAVKNRLNCTFAVQGNDVVIFYIKTVSGGSDPVMFGIHSYDLMDNWNYDGIFSGYEDIQKFKLVTDSSGINLILIQNDFYNYGEIYGLYYLNRCGGVFSGNMEIPFPVYSKEDIYLKFDGGYPEFQGLVMTDGIFRLYPSGLPAIGNIPVEEIFPEGYIEYAGINGELPESINLYGFVLYGSNNYDVINVKIDGTNNLCRYGNYIETEEDYIVYDSFPDSLHGVAIGDSIWTNETGIREIDWVDETFPLQVINSGVIVYCDLWISGTVSGRQNWYSTKDIYITDDLLYENVEIGNAPNHNTQESLWLCSEKSIYIKYKSRDTFTGELMDNNCDGVNIYALLTALGTEEAIGSNAEYSAGTLRGEYIHPHGSTPGCLVEGEEIKYPDLHKYVCSDIAYFTGDEGFVMHSNEAPEGYPCCGFPYEDPDYGNGTVTPYGTDFPGYNPVYPESSEDIVFERGTVHLWGGLYSRIFPQLKCSGISSVFHGNNIWEPDVCLFGGTHAPAGWEVDFHADTRLQSQPEIFNGFAANLPDNDYDLRILRSTNGGLSFHQQYHEHFINSSYEAKGKILTASEGNELAILYPLTNGYRLHYYNTQMGYIQTRIIDSSNFDGKLRSLFLQNGIVYFKDENNIYSYENNTLQSINNLPGEDFNDFYISENWQIQWKADWYLECNPDQLEFIFYIADENWELTELSSTELVAYEYVQADYLKKLKLLFDTDRYGKLLLFTDCSSAQALYTTQEDLEHITPSESEEITCFEQFSLYPNPFNPQLKITWFQPQAEKMCITVYNQKGQRLKELVNQYYAAGNHEIIWEGKDKENNLCSSGIYLIIGKTESKVYRRKAVLMK